uniref:Uncharacterized protein n=1 Tax=Glossina austeni TaxID=7395 RepID=A0A1A9V7G1_GLOAU
MVKHLLNPVYTRVEELKRNFEIKLSKELPVGTQFKYGKMERKSKIKEIVSLFDTKISNIIHSNKREKTNFETLIDEHSPEREPQPKPTIALIKPIPKTHYNFVHNENQVSNSARKPPVIKYAKSLNNEREKSQLQHPLSEQDVSQLSVKNKTLLYTKFIEDMLKGNAKNENKNINCYQENVSQASVKRLVEEYEKRCLLTQRGFSAKNQSQLIEELDENEAHSLHKASVEIGEINDPPTPAKNLKITININKFLKEVEHNHDFGSPSTTLANVNADNTQTRKKCNEDMYDTTSNENIVLQGNLSLLRNQEWKELFHNWLKKRGESFFNSNFSGNAGAFPSGNSNLSESSLLSQKCAFNKFLEEAVEKLKNECSKGKETVCVDEKKSDSHALADFPQDIILDDTASTCKAKSLETESGLLSLSKSTNDGSQHEHHNVCSPSLRKKISEFMPSARLPNRKESCHTGTRAKESSNSSFDFDSDFERFTSNQAKKLLAESEGTKRKLFAESKKGSNDVVFDNEHIEKQKHFKAETASLHKIKSAYAGTCLNLTSTPTSESAMADKGNCITQAARCSPLRHSFVKNVCKISGFIKEKLKDCSLIESQPDEDSKVNGVRTSLLSSEITFNNSPTQTNTQTSSPDKLVEYPSNFSTPKLNRKYQSKQQNFISSVRLPLKNRRASVHESESRRSSGVMQAIQENQPLKHYDVWSTSPKHSSISAQQFSDANADKTSTFWIKSGDFLLTLDIYYVEPEKLRFHYDMLCQESGKNQTVHFGIDNYKFSIHETTQNESRLSSPKLSSHYWFATDNIAIPFSGKPLNGLKIKRIFGFVSASVLETGLLRFGVDRMEFSKIPEFVLDTQHLSLESNWSQLIGLQTGYSNGLEGRGQYAWPSTKFYSEENDNEERDELSYPLNGNNSVLSDFNAESFSVQSNYDAMLDADSQYCSDSLDNVFKRNDTS